MKKSGFTLSELLVALAVVGIVAAIVSPIINNILPDKNKVAVLKLHKLITDLNEQLLDNPTYYYALKDAKCEGLACTDAALDDTTIKTTHKYSKLLQKHLQLKKTGTTSFTTIDGYVWKFSNSSANFAHKTNKYAILEIDTDPSRAGSTIYSSTNTKKIDTFRFKINPDGSVEGDDSLTKAYLRNPHKLNDRKADYDVAKSLEPEPEE